MLIEIIVLLVSIGLISWCLWKMKVGYWNSRGVEYDSGKFPFGNIKEIIFMRKTIGEVYDDIYQSMGDSPFKGIFRFWYPALVVKDPELIKTILVTKFNNFHDNDYYVNPKVDPILGLNPFNSKGDSWIKSRMVITPSITTAKIKAMSEQILNVCEEMANYIRKNTNEYHELQEFCGKYTTDVVGACAYGISNNSFENPNSVLRLMSAKMFDGSFRGQIALFCALYAPSLGNILKFKILSEEVIEYFIGIVNETVNYRRENDVTRNDYLQSLINTNLEAEKNGEEPVYSIEELAAHAMTFFLDGFETAALLISFILYELSVNEDVQNRLRVSIRENGSSIKSFEFDQVSDLEYLDMVVMETLRKHPPGTSLARTCTKTTLLKSGDIQVLVEEGVPVILPMYSMQNDPKYFPDPDKFDPLRFLPENVNSRPQFSYFPLGGGPRSCPGQKFAMYMVKMCVLTVILQFSLEPKYPLETKLQLDPMNAFFHSAKNGLWVKFKSLSETTIIDGE